MRVEIQERTERSRRGENKRGVEERRMGSTVQVQYESSPIRSEKWKYKREQREVEEDKTRKD